jgi:hypothetical protein
MCTRRGRHRHGGFEVRPYEFEGAFSSPHQVAIPNMGLTTGDMFDLKVLARDCAEIGVHEFLLVDAPLPVPGAVGAPVNPMASSRPARCFYLLCHERRVDDALP